MHITTIRGIVIDTPFATHARELSYHNQSRAERSPMYWDWIMTKRGGQSPSFQSSITSYFKHTTIAMLLLKSLLNFWIIYLLLKAAPTLPHEVVVAPLWQSQKRNEAKIALRNDGNFGMIDWGDERPQKYSQCKSSDLPVISAGPSFEDIRPTQMVSYIAGVLLVVHQTTNDAISTFLSSVG